MTTEVVQVGQFDADERVAHDSRCEGPWMNGIFRPRLKRPRVSGRSVSPAARMERAQLEVMEWDIV